MSKKNNKDTFFIPSLLMAKEVTDGLGPFIASPVRLLELAKEKRSIAHRNLGIKPAIFICNMNLMYIMNQINMGNLREYTAKTKRK